MFRDLCGTSATNFRDSGKDFAAKDGAKNGASLGKGPVLAPQQFLRNSSSSENSRSVCAKGNQRRFQEPRKATESVGRDGGERGNRVRGRVSLIHRPQVIQRIDRRTRQ